ncbi:MAG: hypothetical protein LBI67_03375 [Treponema sp.]|jgi:hypothetical protein|nr:hypothetical protein [Treponema sp.]
MKKQYWPVMGLCVLFFSCMVFPPPVTEAWSSSGTVNGEIMSVGKINVDSSGSRDSLEREITGILPLLLLENGYRLPEPGGVPPDFTVDVSVIEREYMESWQTKRSLSVEVRIWQPETTLPLAAGRAMLSGNKSFSSSKVTNTLLRSALSKALSVFEAGHQNQKQGIGG